MRSLLLLLFAFALACSASGSTAVDGAVETDETGAPAAQALTELWGLEKVFRITQEWDRTGDVAFPLDPVPDEHFLPVSEERTLKVVFSADGQGVEIGDTPLAGTARTIEALDATWDLGDGTFAGGRFLVWIEAGVFQAELTIYGSGLPVVSSERGFLE